MGESMTVETNDVLTSFEIPALTDVGDGQFDNVWVKHNPALVSFVLSALTRVTSMRRPHSVKS
ncbi:MAG: hypothetical protein GY898_33905 [Proteobacteria bacterium]|nr:hypothetical protein [Pseudomonadota bacterium]